MKYYLVSHSDDFIIDFSKPEEERIIRIERAISRSTDKIAFDPNEQFPLFTGSVFTKRALKAMSHIELVDEVFSAAIRYQFTRKDYYMAAKTAFLWLKERDFDLDELAEDEDITYLMRIVKGGE